MLKRLLFLLACIFLQYSIAFSQNYLKKFVSVGSFAKLGNTLFFAANDGITGTELWKTDGTIAGTVLLKDINSVSTTRSSGVAELFAFNGKLYFSANDGINGTELWTSDGTTAGTILLKDICTTRGNNNSSFPSQFTICNGLLYFSASQDGNYSSLWRTDGTATGTLKLTSDNYFGVNQLTAVGQSLYFTINGNRNLWKTDGTIVNTKLITTDDYETVDLLRNVNNELVFISNKGYKQKIRLYKLNPSDDQPLLLRSFDAVGYGSVEIDNITAVGADFYFSIKTYNDASQGLDALWKSNKTAIGTTMIKAFGWERYMSGSGMGNFISYNDKLYFSSSLPHKLYTSDGTDAGTVKLSDAVVTHDLRAIISNQKIFFGANAQLWSYDGSIAKKEFDQPANPGQLYDVDGKLYLISGDNFNKTLWNNDASQILSVTKDFSPLVINSTTTFTSTKDSAAVSTITISNQGTKPLVFSEISVTGSSFYLSGKCDQSLAPGAQISLKLIYYPAQEEILKGILTIKSNDNAANAFTAFLSGTAVGKARKANVLTDGITKSIVFNDTQPSFTLNANTIEENLTSGSIIGSFQMPATADTYTYSFINGSGDSDNSSFSIVNGELKSAAVFNYEGKNTYSIRVKATGATTSFEKVFIVTVTDVPESVPPADCTTSVKSLLFELYDIGYFGTSLVAVGSAGKIIKSTDNGQNWVSINSGTAISFTKLNVTDDHTGYIFGSGGLFKTENSGDTWFNIDAPIAGASISYFYSSDIGFVLGDGGVFKTTNGGKNWKKQTLPLLPGVRFLSAWFTDENNGFICGTSQTLLKTRNGGDTWEKIELTGLSSNNPVSITFTNASTGYILSSTGDVLRTNDSGATWASISSIGATANSIYFKNANEGYIISSGVIFKTINSGITWTRISLVSNESFSGLAINKTNNNYCLVGRGSFYGAIGTQGSCIYLNNGSGNWVKKSGITNTNFTNANFTDANNGYLFTGYGYYKTTDGGITWKEFNVPIDASEYITSSYFINNDIGFYCTITGIYRTIDGGNTWIKTSVDDRFQGSKFNFISTQIGFVSSEYGYVFKTTDGGVTWQKGTSSPTNGGFQLFDIQFLDAQTGYTIFLNSLYKTTNQGNTWVPTDFGNDGKFLTSVYFIDNQTGLVGENTGRVFRTTNGGVNWAEIYTPTGLPIRSFAFPNSQHGYAFAKYPSGAGELYETQDGGLTWSFVLQNFNLTKMQQSGNDIYLIGGGEFLKLTSSQNNVIHAGYITGPINPQALIKTNYTIPTIANTSWQWAVTGPADIEYQGNSINVTWKQSGNYTLTATPSIPCGSGTSRTLDIVVSDISKPVIRSYYLSGSGLSKTITITGDNFLNANQVSVSGTVLSSFIISSPTTITAPLGSTPIGDIAVTNPGGTTIFAYANPPVIVALNTKNGYADSTITITGNNFIGITDVSFGTSAAKSFTVNSTNTITAILANGSSGNVAVTGTYGIATLSGFIFHPKPIITSVSQTTASAGTTIYIYGSNFIGVSAVTFGGVAAESFIVNSNSILAKVAANSASGNIELTAPTGKTSVSGFVFIPQPAITAISYSISGSDIIATITGSNFNTVYGVFMSGYAIKSYTVNSSTSITAIYAAGLVGDILINTSGGSVSSVGIIPKTTSTITFANIPNAVYGDADIILNAVSTNPNTPVIYAVDNTNIALLQNNKLYILKAGTIKVTASQSGDAAHFAATDVAKTVIVSPKVLLVKSNNQTRLYGETNPNFSITYTGFVNGDDESKLISKPTVTTTTTNSSPVGIYDLVPGAARSDNYEFNYSNGKLTILPTLTNFRVSAGSITCKGQNNGSITIDATVSHNYTAIVTGNSINKTQEFNTKLNFDNLSPGLYNVCITDNELPDYKRYFNITVIEPQDLTLYSVVNNSTNVVNLTLNGGANYNIELNGDNYKTSNNAIVLPLKRGNNRIVLTSDLICQGKVELLIHHNPDPVSYPNPFTNLLYVDLGETVAKTATIQLYSVVDGKLKLTAKYLNASGVLKLDVGQLPFGVYTMHLITDLKKTIFKVIKK